MRCVSSASAVVLAIVAVSSRAHAGPQDIPPPGEETSAPEPTSTEATPSVPLTERFHVEASLLLDPKYDVMFDNEDSVLELGSHNGHGPLFGGEGFVSYRLSTSFHVGVGARYLRSTRSAQVDPHLLQIPLRLTWISPLFDGGWLAYGVGAGFGRAWFTPSADFAIASAVNGAYAEARVAFVKRLFATFDALVSVTGWVGPFVSNGFGSYGVTLGLGVRFGA